jgi:uncharacterized protein YutE (UPF0331/DUF86 family)
MYFVDRRKIKEILDYLDRLLGLFEKGQWNTDINQLALERITQNVIESMIDVGNQMIDGFIMRDPGGYEDVIDILEDESVLPHEEAEPIRNVVGLRKMLVQHYTAVNHNRLKQTLSDAISPLKHFSGRISDYIEKELGPVSAFSPDQPGNNK